MSVPQKTSSLQSYHMLVYRKALHPEFFGIEARQRIRQEEYEAEAWIFRGGHCLRMQHQGQCFVEVILENADTIPNRGVVASLPCAGERDHEEQFGDSMLYMTTIQTETLSEHLYLGTYREMLQHARDSDSLVSMWTDDHGKPNLSVFDLQATRAELHLQGYHLRSDCGMVLRTQSMFQIMSPKELAKRPKARPAVMPDDESAGE